MTDQTPTPPLSRRTLLRTGGVVSLGALIAACGGEQSDAPGRVGNVPPTTALPTAEVNDAVLLRTGASVEYTAIDVINRMVDENIVDATYSDMLQRFVADHTAHAEKMNELATAAGGETFTCANPWLQDRAIDPMFVAIVGDEDEGIEASDDPNRDGLNSIVAIENVLAASFQALAAKLSTPELRLEAALIAATEARHGSLLAYKVTGSPAGYVDPALVSTTPQEVEGIAAPYALSSRFGSLTGITFKLGKADAAGAIPEVTLDTPAENAYVYEYVTC